MRILIATEYFPTTYKLYIEDQATEFVRQGAEVSFASMGRWAERAGSRLRSVVADPRVQYLPSSLRAPGALRGTLRRALSGPLTATRKALRIARAHGVEMRGLNDLARLLALDPAAHDVCLVHDLTTMVALRALPSVFPDLPVALWYHGGEVPGTRVLEPGEVREGLSGVRLAFVNTEYAASHLASRGFPRDRIEIAPLGLYPDDFAPPEGRTFVPEGVLRLLFVGRLSPEKGLLDVFGALELLDPSERERVRLRIVGSGPQADELEAAASSLAGCVEFVGRLGRAGVAREIDRADCLVLASVPMQTWEETQALVIQEAMCSGLPALTTRMGALEEVVPETSRTMQVAPGSPSAIADRIRRLSALDASEWRRWSAECADFVRHKFDIQRETGRVLSALRSIA